MKRILLAASVIFAIGACIPFSPVPNPGPTIDVAASVAANVQTASALTLAVQPTDTFVLPTETLEPTLTPEPTLGSETVMSPTLPNTTVMETVTGNTATFEVPTSTNVAASSGTASAVPTLTIRTFGTLPPAVPFSNVTLINRARAEAYISLQVVTEQGGPTIIEYPVEGRVRIQAPIGHYLYVAWVGGRKMVGEFRLKRDQDLSILLYRDRIEIK